MLDEVIKAVKGLLDGPPVEEEDVEMRYPRGNMGLDRHLVVLKIGLPLKQETQGITLELKKILGGREIGKIGDDKTKIRTLKSRSHGGPLGSPTLLLGVVLPRSSSSCHFRGGILGEIKGKF